MPPSSNSVLVYFTHNYLSSDQASLLDQLNQPNRQFTRPYNLPDRLEPSNEVDLVGKSVDEIVELHKSWVERNNIDPKFNISGSMFIIVDQGIPPSGVHSVQVVYLVDGPSKYESIRVAVSQAVGVVTTIDGGQQDWSDFMYSAQPHGVLPGCEAVQGGNPRSGGQGTGETGLTSISTKQLPHKPRPTDT